MEQNQPKKTDEEIERDRELLEIMLEDRHSETYISSFNLRKGEGY